MMYGEHMDVDHLRTVVIGETQFRDTLEEYCNELSAAIAELEEQKQKGDEQSSEWKTRFEIQQELNEQLRKQTATLQNEVAEATRTSHDYQKNARTNAAPAAFGSATESMINALESEKQALGRQSENIEMRVDQEAKAYHKANEERKAVQLDIAAVNAQMGALKMSPTSASGNQVGESTAAHGSGQQRSQHRMLPKSGGGGIEPKNIPPNQRVIDPKKGPIKRTAAVKQLPPL